MIELSHCLLVNNSPTRPVISNGSTEISWQQFQRAVTQTSTMIDAKGDGDWALFTHQKYPFLVALVALLAKGKTVYIAANNKPLTVLNLRQKADHLLGDFEHGLDIDNGLENSVEPVCLQNNTILTGKLVVFTSGSTGQPKSIVKSIQQLDSEIATLEDMWGELLGDSHILSTVSHQHIYGLLFTILWPLCSGRVIENELFMNPASLMSRLLEKAKACWVASPAQLKRIHEQLPWGSLSQKLTAIFSSGGPLVEKSAFDLFKWSGVSAIEVYGSSETGGVAYRQQRPGHKSGWIPLKHVEWRIAANGALEIRSPHLANEHWLELDDSVSAHPVEGFELAGRRDRIVKIEEKRLSLAELEQTLDQSGLLHESRAVLLDGQRQRIGVAAVPSSSAIELMRAEGKLGLIHRLKPLLAARFESVQFPKKWRFVECLPINSQGKLDEQDVKALFTSSGRIVDPIIRKLSLTDNKMIATLFIPPDLDYFKGHFSKAAVVPGVVQIRWADTLSQKHLGIDESYYAMKAIKFNQLMFPCDEVLFECHWDNDKRALHFSFTSENKKYSSGRLLMADAL